MTSEREARRIARQKAAHRRAEPDAAPAGETAIRSKPVRITVDLTPELYRRLTRMTADFAEEIDVAKLPISDLVRAFIRAADEDASVKGRVASELRNLKQ